MDKIPMKSLKILNDKFRCRTCGSENTCVNMYPHDGGYPVEGHELKQWIYLHCNECLLDTKLAVALQQVQNQAYDQDR